MKEITMAASTKFLRSVVISGLLAGTLDLAGAVLSQLLVQGKFPVKILEYIASGAFGNSAMDGSLGSNLWGLFFHYLLALSFTLFYYFIYPAVNLLQKRVIVSAILYGLFVWIVTNMMILPLSALQTPVLPIDRMAALRAAIVLIVCIGLPVSYFAQRYYRAGPN